MIAERHTSSFPALGTTALVVVAAPGDLARAEAVLRAELERIDRACSRFRDDSDLSRLNRAAGAEVTVGPLLIEALEVAVRAAVITDGDVDPTVGRAIGDLGYDRDFSLIGGLRPGVRVRFAPVPGWCSLRIDSARGTVTAPEGVLVDLGATAKALAADRAAAAIHDVTGGGVLVSLGGDIALCGEAPDEGWPVNVTEDHRDLEGGQIVAVHAGGLATSSTTVRRWESPDGTRHHILDPRRGAPAAEVWRTVTVAAGTCVDANIASTAAIIRGVGAPEWLSAAGLPARMVAQDGTVLRIGGWPEQER